ncbi:S1C family serine protease [Stappia indica]|uniref:S1C family serine protease n=1 Tax=Stappia indica TaxID=538381 RepID=UPI001D191076|nr:trypsin-like peptidase domain-containing protein [Stappia indica]MCC4245862.1 trypsin-like peptidase domain-containing protein [Stappia indica]
MIRQAAAVLALALVAAPAAVAETAGSAAALRSVVALLPDWPADQQRTEEPEGSAVVVGEGGLMLTANHVVGAAKTVRIRLGDGSVHTAEIAYRDQETDLAVLRANIDLPVLEMAPEPEPATSVCAFGNAFGLGVSVTCGVVSATGRGGIGFNAVEDFLQTDTAVNPGASGGALVDAQGRLVGILSAIYTKSGDGDIGVNFAVSSALARRVLQAAADGRSPRRSLGASLRPTRPGPLAAGLEVLSVREQSPAAQAGMRGGDVILAVDDWPVASVALLRGRLERADAGGVLTLRRGESVSEVQLDLAD